MILSSACRSFGVSLETSAVKVVGAKRAIFLARSESPAGLRFCAVKFVASSPMISVSETRVLLVISQCLPVFQNLDERGGAQFRQREPGKFERLGLSDCTAVDCAQEIIEQPLSGRRVVENIADERGLRGLLDEVLQTF